MKEREEEKRHRLQIALHRTTNMKERSNDKVGSYFHLTELSSFYFQLSPFICICCWSLSSFKFGIDHTNVATTFIGLSLLRVCWKAVLLSLHFRKQTMVGKLSKLTLKLLHYARIKRKEKREMLLRECFVLHTVICFP